MGAVANPDTALSAAVITGNPPDTVPATANTPHTTPTTGACATNAAPAAAPAAAVPPITATLAPIWQTRDNPAKQLS